MKSMKAKVNYTDEPKDGMELPEKGVAVLSRTQQRTAGIPAPQPPGTEYERTEKAGVVTLRPLRGGKRDGAGRKPSGHVRMQLLISTSTRKKIQRLAKRQNVTLSEAVERAVAAL